MLKIKSNQWFDLNYAGVGLITLMMFLVVFFSLPIIFKLGVEILLVASIYYLYNKIIDNQKLSIMINSENEWFIQDAEESLSVELKDYWLLTGKIFIWLHGTNKSVSIVVSRSIIGEQFFSQLRSKIL